jgi:hypothetical protein
VDESDLYSSAFLARLPVEIPDQMPDYGLITRLGEVPTPAALEFMGALHSLADAAALHSTR